MEDRLYFRQLLAAATSRPTIRSRGRWSTSCTSSATARPARRSRSIPRTACASSSTCSRADGMRLTGVLVTHYHPDHVGGDLGGLGDRGRRASCSRSTTSTCRCTCRRRRRTASKRVTGASDSDLVLHTSGDIVTVGDDADHADPHAGPHARSRSASSSTAGSSRATRCSSTAAAAPTCPAAIPPRSTRASRRSSRSCPTTPCCSPATCTPRSRPRRWATCVGSNYVFRPRPREQWMMMFGN